MKDSKAKKRWVMCSVCYQLVYTAGPGTGNHTCPELLRAKHEAELDMVVHEEMTTWDEDVKRFWNSRDVKFWDYLLKQKRQI